MSGSSFGRIPGIGNPYRQNQKVLGSRRKTAAKRTRYPSSGLGYGFLHRLSLVTVANDYGKS